MEKRGRELKEGEGAAGGRRCESVLVAEAEDLLFQLGREGREGPSRDGKLEEDVGPMNGMDTGEGGRARREERGDEGGRGSC